jgi:hypothetical protein
MINIIAAVAVVVLVGTEVTPSLTIYSTTIMILPSIIITSTSSILSSIAQIRRYLTRLSCPSYIM